MWMACIRLKYYCAGGGGKQTKDIRKNNKTLFLRSTSTTNMQSSMYERRSVERDTTDMKSKRTASAQGLDRSSEGKTGLGGTAGGVTHYINNALCYSTESTVC